MCSDYRRYLTQTTESLTVSQADLNLFSLLIALFLMYCLCRSIPLFDLLDKNWKKNFSSFGFAGGLQGTSYIPLIRAFSPLLETCKDCEWQLLLGLIEDRAGIRFRQETGKKCLPLQRRSMLVTAGNSFVSLLSLHQWTTVGFATLVIMCVCPIDRSLRERERGG